MAVLGLARSAIVVALVAGTAVGTALVASLPTHVLQAQAPQPSPAPDPGSVPSIKAPALKTPPRRSASSPTSGAGTDSVLEYGVKAAYLLNFTRYVEWPRAVLAERTPVVLCVYGSDPFGEVLERTVRGRTSQGRRIDIRRTDLAAEARDCHAVFVSEAEWRREPDVLEALTQRGVLTVGEGAAFADAGGIISFVIENHAVRFVVNTTASKRADIRLSSRLLALATHVYGERKTEP